MNLRTCVSPSGRFVYGTHRPRFRVENLRAEDHVSSLGLFNDGRSRDNQTNFPAGAVDAEKADWIYEIPNAFPFRGTTYITKSWADGNAANPTAISLPEKPSVSLSRAAGEWFDDGKTSQERLDRVFLSLPEPLLLALAATSTDKDDLVRLAGLCCEFIRDPGSNRPVGLRYERKAGGGVSPLIKNGPLFETLVNNRFLPDDYKEVMVLRPGVQGGSEIVGDWLDMEEESHIFEYLRRNSYIPWGHYAANMANDAVRYRIEDLTLADMTGLRHLYYQRTYVRMADQVGFDCVAEGKRFSEQELEELRQGINAVRSSDPNKSVLKFDRTLWGWNFGFDYAPSHYRLHASHQQIHQQFALIPSSVPVWNQESRDGRPAGEIPAYACGDLIGGFVGDYHQQTGRYFFDDYIQAIRNNTRMDDKNGESSLVVYEDGDVMVFVPKAQTSQWELQLVCLKPVGNILETDTAVRRALDRGMLTAVKILAAMGARMITSIEYSKRFDSSDGDHRLLYAFLPKLPESPGAFSEAQLRWINGHYPEDFASACRSRLPEVLK
ncbi:MAG: hypothetical protein GY866_22365 [Proteobacteria bacterium]|nr:hypothetical protein [Pseudomonadota bacterium]